MIESLWWFIFLGLLVGTLVGLTGLGGGTLMTPLLIISGLPPIVAIGTDIVYAAITKSFASIIHIKEKNVEYKVVAVLLSGSLPGLIMGYFFSQIILDNFGTDGLNFVLTIVLSIILISLSLISIIAEISKFVTKVVSDHPDEISEEYETLLDEDSDDILEDIFINRHTYSLIIGAFTVGVLVQLTSVGSGVLITILLLGILPAKRVVGTELVHASILVAFSAIIYSTTGFVDFGILWKILLGAVFGILIGIRFSKKIPQESFKIILLGVIFFAGIIILIEGASTYIH